MNDRMSIYPEISECYEEKAKGFFLKAKILKMRNPICKHFSIYL